MSILVTDNAVFIGSNFVFEWLRASDQSFVNLDKLTCTSNLENFASLQVDARQIFARGNLGDRTLMNLAQIESLAESLIKSVYVKYLGSLLKAANTL
jgi:dTDP-D-glucose 4,6-dehydratase